MKKWERFNMEDGVFNIKQETFKQGNLFSNDEESLGGIYIKGENVLQKEIDHAINIPNDQRVLIRVDERSEGSPYRPSPRKGKLTGTRDSSCESIKSQTVTIV